MNIDTRLRDLFDRMDKLIRDSALIHPVKSANQLLRDSYALGSEYGLLDAATVDDVAQRLDLSHGRVRAIARQLSVGRCIGSGSRAVWLFSAGDVAAMESRRDGRSTDG